MQTGSRVHPGRSRIPPKARSDLPTDVHGPAARYFWTPVEKTSCPKPNPSFLNSGGMIVFSNSELMAY